MRELFGENYRLLKSALKQVGLFELIYKAIFVLLVLPLSSFLFDLSLKAAGYRYLTNDNIYVYLKSPLTWGLVLLIILLNLLYVLGEFSTLTICFQAVRTRAPIRFWRAFATGMRKTAAMLRPKNCGMLLIGLLMIPITNSALWFGLLTLFKMPGIVSRFFDSHVYVLILAILLFLTLEVFALGALFAVHCYTIKRRRFRNAVKESFHLLKKRFGKMILRYLVWNLIIFAIILFAYFVVVSLIVLGILVANVKKGVELALFLSCFRIANLALLVFASIFSVLANLAFITNLFNRYQHSDVGYRVLEVVKLVQPREGHRPRRIVTGVLLTIVIALNGVYAYLLLNDAAVNYLSNLGVPQITSHRGNSVAAPENTMLAIEYAVRDLSDCAEIDVQETADGELIIIHDSNLKRTTGLDKNVWEVTYNEIQDLDAGFWFDPKLQDAKIPTLDEVLEYCKGKNIKLNIELKGYEHSQHLEESVVKTIEKYKMEDQCYLTSFSYSCLRNVKTLNSKLRTGYIVSASYGSFYQMKYADFFSVRATSVTKSMVNNIHAAGKEIHVWTVNGKRGLQEMTELGVDNIITDNPVLAREVVYSGNTNTGLLEILELIFS